MSKSPHQHKTPDLDLSHPVDREVYLVQETLVILKNLYPLKSPTVLVDGNRIQVDMNEP